MIGTVKESLEGLRNRVTVANDKIMELEDKLHNNSKQQKWEKSLQISNLMMEKNSQRM